MNINPICTEGLKGTLLPEGGQILPPLIYFKSTEDRYMKFCMDVDTLMITLFDKFQKKILVTSGFIADLISDVSIIF